MTMSLEPFFLPRNRENDASGYRYADEGRGNALQRYLRQLRQILMTMSIRSFAFGLLLTCSVVPVLAQPISQPYCALEVHVQSRAHEDLKQVPVVMLSSDGASEERAITDENGLVRFCNPKMNSFHEVRVGRRKCWVEIHQVHLVWPRPLRLEALLDECEQTGLDGFCEIVIHLRDHAGHPLEGLDFGVSANTSASVLRWTPKSDEFGRIFATVLWRKPARGILRKTGRVFETVSLDCNDMVREWTMIVGE
jgi:hypothetical protein